MKKVIENFLGSYICNSNPQTKWELLNYDIRKIIIKYIQFVIFKPLSYYFEETIGFDVNTPFASRPL